MNNAHIMFHCVELSFERGAVDICMDFADCTSVDSTFMGTLLLIHEECHKRTGKLQIVNLRDEVREKLKEIGIANILSVHQRAAIPNFQFEVLPDSVEKSSKIQLILKAHERLTQENPENDKRFGLFVRELKEGMNRSSS